MTALIWKYVVPVANRDDKATTTTAHNIPDGARFLACQVQYGDIALWYEVPNGNAAEYVRHDFRVFVTGQESVPANYSYIGTTQHYGGTLVLHVYEVSA